MKCCVKCNKVKIPELFNKKLKSKDGLDSYCKECKNEHSRLYNQLHKEKRAVQKKEWNLKNKEKTVRSSIRYQIKRNDKSYSKRYAKQYRKNNKPKLNNYKAMRRAGLKTATPKWLSESQRLQTLNIYKECHELNYLGVDIFEVDHIVPLKGKTVCGLHVPWNLRIIPRSQNRRKINKLEQLSSNIISTQMGEKE